jgi:hypothetical protein
MYKCKNCNSDVVKPVNNKSKHPDNERDYSRGLKIAEEFGLKYNY